MASTSATAPVVDGADDLAAQNADDLVAGEDPRGEAGFGLSPVRIQAVRFPRAWRGYDPRRVDAFVDEVAATVAGLRAALAERSEGAAAPTGQESAVGKPAGIPQPHPRQEEGERAVGLTVQAVHLLLADALVHAERTQVAAETHTARLLEHTERAVQERLRAFQTRLDRLLGGFEAHAAGQPPGSPSEPVARAAPTGFLADDADGGHAGATSLDPPSASPTHNNGTAPPRPPKERP